MGLLTDPSVPETRVNTTSTIRHSELYTSYRHRQLAARLDVKKTIVCLP